MALASPFRTLVLAISLWAASPADAKGTDGRTIVTTEAPAEFAVLERPRELLVDLYFGNRKIGETWIVARPGSFRFRDPAEVMKLVPDLKPVSGLAQTLAGDLDTHAGAACSEGQSQGCGRLEPQTVGAIFDEQRFRLDLFVNPEFLGVAGSSAGYLPSPVRALSFTSSIGGALAGSTTGRTNYNIQNRTIVGFGNARIRSDSSIASGLGIVVDDLVAEVDTKRHRYSGGLFWAPGVDLTGRRRIAGLGFTTQFDTREDSKSLEATPLVVFLRQASRVEVLIDGRLVTSQTYDAGNRSIDVSSMPDGSYPVVLRIREPDGSVRDERRFFVKNAAIAPLGEQVYFAYAGLLANTRANRPISLSKTLYYQVGTARRLNEALAVDVAVLGTKDDAIGQAGAWLLTDIARVRAAALASVDGDKGLLFQLGSAGAGPLNFSFDLRRVWSPSGEPLIPLPNYVDTFGSTPLIGGQSVSGSYAQASGSVSLAIGDALVGVTGTYRRDRGAKADYGIGPSLSWPVINRGGLQVVLAADAQRSRETTAAFGGVRVFFSRGSFSTLSTTGYASVQSRGGRDAARNVGSFSAQWSHFDDDRTQLGAEAAVQRDVQTTVARASARADTRLGSARVDVLHNLEGRGGTQYGLSFQTGLASGGRVFGLGGRDLNQSAIIASLDGSSEAAFDVLVDDVVRGRLGAGSRLPIFLEGYRSYRVRLRPIAGSAVAFDGAEKLVTVYPGNVQQVRWTADRLVTVFGQAVDQDGKPLVDAFIAVARGIGQTDANGYFEIDASLGDTLVLTSAAGTACKVPLAGLETASDYARVGRVICK